MIKLFRLTILLISLCYLGAALAVEPPPLTMVKTASTSVLSALQKNKSQLKNKQFVHNIINSIAIPHFNLDNISKTVVGRNHWTQASPNLQRQFIVAFKRYVIDMYSSAIAAYTDETLSFSPIRNYSPSSNRVQIKSVVNRKAAPSVDLDYRVERLGSTWKIYDFSVDGVSMVQSYRSQFAEILNRGGLQELTNKLQARK